MLIQQQESYYIFYQKKKHPVKLRDVQKPIQFCLSKTKMKKTQ